MQCFQSKTGAKIQLLLLFTKSCEKYFNELNQSFLLRKLTDFIEY